MPVALNLCQHSTGQNIKEFKGGMLIVEYGTTDSGRYEIAATWGKGDTSTDFQHFSYTTSNYSFTIALFNAISSMGIERGKKAMGLK